MYLFGQSWKPVTRLRTEVELRVQEATDLAHPPPSLSAVDSFGDIELSGNGHSKSAQPTGAAPKYHLFGLSSLEWPTWRRRLLDEWNGSVDKIVQCLSTSGASSIASGRICTASLGWCVLALAH